MAPALHRATIMKTLTCATMLAVALTAGCSNEKSEAPAPSPSPTESQPTQTGDESPQAAVEEAHTMFKTVCATCHGQDGRGDGPAAASLNPKPRNYTDKVWQASVTDDQIKNTILMGGAAVGKSPAMPAQPQLREKPLVVDELVRIVREFGK